MLCSGTAYCCTPGAAGAQMSRSFPGLINRRNNPVLQTFPYTKACEGVACRAGITLAESTPPLRSPRSLGKLPAGWLMISEILIKYACGAGSR